MAIEIVLAIYYLENIKRRNEYLVILVKIVWIVLLKKWIKFYTNFDTFSRQKIIAMTYDEKTRTQCQNKSLLMSWKM